MNKQYKNIFKEDIVVPDIVQLKAEEAFSQIKKKGTENMKENNIIPMEMKTTKCRKIVKPIIAACICGSLFIAAGKFNNLHLFNHVNETNTAETYLKTAEGGDLTQALSNMFTLKVYASDSPEAGENGYVALESGKSFVIKEDDMGYVLCETEEGGISYCIGTQFMCEGENVERITYSINKGAFQIVEPPKDSSILEGEAYEGFLNTGLIGGEESESGEEILSVRRLYKSFTLSYDEQSNDQTWINICNVTDLPWETLYNENNTLEDRVNAIEEIMKDVVITCTVQYTDGTCDEGTITIGGGIITPEPIGIPEKDQPYAGFEFLYEQ